MKVNLDAGYPGMGRAGLEVAPGTVMTAELIETWCGCRMRNAIVD